MPGYTAQQAYDQIKALEQNHFPVPTSTGTVQVGTIDGATGKFQFAVPTTSITMNIPSTPPSHHPVTLTETVGIVYANVVDLSLEFLVVNPSGPFAVNGVTAAAGQNSIALDIGAFVSAPFEPIPGQKPPYQYSIGTLVPMTVSVQAGGFTTRVFLQVVRPPIIGAGAFTIPALPVALVYAPPADSDGSFPSTASFQDSISSGRKISASMSSGTSTKTSPAYSLLDVLGKITGLGKDLASFAATLGSSGSGGSGSGGSGSGGVAGLQKYTADTSLALDLLSGILTNTSVSVNDSITISSDNALQVTDTLSQTWTSAKGQGPGVGDVFVYLLNVSFVWLVSGGQMMLSPLIDDSQLSWAAFSTADLSSDLNAIKTTGVTAGPQTGLDASTLTSLLALDPFVANPTPTFDPGRFVPEGVHMGGGTGAAGDQIQYKHEVTATDSTTQTDVTTTITDTKPGWFQVFLGNDTETQVQTLLSYSSSVQNTQDETITETFNVVAPPGVDYKFWLYYDRLFCTFACSPTAPVIVSGGPSPRLVST